MSKIVSNSDSVAVITKRNIHLFNQRTTESFTLPAQTDKTLEIDFAQFSPSHQHLAVLYSDKSLQIWKQLDTEGQHPMKWSRVKTANVPRRSLVLAFDLDEKVVYVGDKCGNVYIYKVVGEEGEEKKPPVIGHISMLLDMECTSNYIITADRDERVRVSDIARPHVIRSFCLGHQEFVCRCLAVGAGQNLLTSSGDGSLKLWRLETGDELASLQVVDDLSSQQVPNIMCAMDHLAVVSSHQSITFRVVSLSDSSLTYRYSVALPVGRKLISCSFASSGLLHVLTADDGKKFGFVAYQLNATGGHSLISSGEKLQKFVSDIPYQSTDNVVDFVDWFKRKNCQNMRYQSFFEKIQKRSAAAAQNENGYLASGDFAIPKKPKTDETGQ